METKINIASILKDKPQGTKLYDWLYNIDVELDTISTTDTETVVWSTNETDNNTTCHRGYSEFGTVRGCNDGLQILLPSKQMRDWSKFVWKKGDVLQKNSRTHVIFDSFVSDTYEVIRCKYFLKVDNGKEIFVTETNVFTNEYFKASEEQRQCYINKIEEHFGGKLNLETLEIEKAQSFNDGDIVFIGSYMIGINANSMIAIFRKEKENDKYEFSPALCVTNEYDTYLREDPVVLSPSDITTSRPATDSEKQQLFDALAKEGKAWDAEKKMIVNIKKEPQFKPFEKVLVRDSYDDMWRACFFSHIREDDGRYVTTCFTWKFCIPYEGNEHLLGTTKDVEG